VRLTKIGSFAFAEGSALYFGEKANVQLVRWDKIVYKKYTVGKDKKYRSIGSRVGCLLVHLSR
jgi:hypothetical protein